MKPIAACRRDASAGIAIPARAASREGFTIMELTIAVTIFLLAMGPLVILSLRSTRAYTSEALRSHQLVRAHQALDRIVEEIRSTGIKIEDLDALDGLNSAGVMNVLGQFGMAGQVNAGEVQGILDGLSPAEASDPQSVLDALKQLDPVKGIPESELLAALSNVGPGAVSFECYRIAEVTPDEVIYGNRVRLEARPTEEGNLQDDDGDHLIDETDIVLWEDFPPFGNNPGPEDSELILCNFGTGNGLTFQRDGDQIRVFVSFQIGNGDNGPALTYQLESSVAVRNTF